jgi:uncharacterized membrane protein YqiK
MDEIQVLARLGWLIGLVALAGLWVIFVCIWLQKASRRK